MINKLIVLAEDTGLLGKIKMKNIVEVMNKYQSDL